MKLFDSFCKYLSQITLIKKDIISVTLLTIFCLSFFTLLKNIVAFFIRKRNKNSRGEYFFNQFLKVFLNIIEVLSLLIVWYDYIQNFMTLISVISAAITISLREMIVNFFAGIYIKVKRPFKVEDRIQIGDIKGDVMNISTFGFDILEVSTEKENGQSTGIVVSFPHSVILTTPVKNISKGFKYIWNELVVKIDFHCDLVKNKQELYKIVNSIETIKNIPRKMKNQILEIGADSRVYFNKYDPIIYTKIVDNHIELTIRYLMHPKKARYVESVIWNKIYEAYQEKKIQLYLK